MSPDIHYDWQALQDSACHPVWITTDAQLDQACAHWSQQPVIALDTEFMRTDTFYPVPGLIQVADQQRCYLLDPLKLKDTQAFTALLENPQVLKVLHAGSEDLELFRHSYGANLAPLFDTQIAAAFAGWGFSMGLQRMVRHALGVELGKAQTTSDWLRRPLSADQVRYAALDVVYLARIAAKLYAELQALGRYDWCLEECQTLSRSVRDGDSHLRHYYRRFTQMSLDTPEQLAGLRDLTYWREITCRERDLCRPRLIKNEVLLEIIRAWPTSLQALREVSGLDLQRVREDGETILSLLRHASSSAEQDPPLPIHLPLHVGWSQEVKKLMACGREIARTEQIQTELLIRRRDVEKLINSRDEQGVFHLPASLCGWRYELIGRTLLDTLNRLVEKREKTC